MAFVQFEAQAHAETALSLNGMMLGDRAIKISLSANAIEKIPDEAEIHQTMAAVEKSKSVMEQIAGEMYTWMRIRAALVTVREPLFFLCDV
jgi:hypothetical protein